jgi:hypothetical protein
MIGAPSTEDHERRPYATVHIRLVIIIGAIIPAGVIRRGVVTWPIVVSRAVVMMVMVIPAAIMVVPRPIIVSVSNFLHLALG